MSEFLAEARVLVRPDTTKFRGELVAQLAVATKGVTVPIPVVPIAGGTAALAAQLQATTGALTGQSAAAAAAGANLEKASQGARALAREELLAETAARKLALAQGEVAGASGAVAAAQITFTRSTAALVAAQATLDAALKIGNAERIEAARTSLLLAENQALEAETALAAARAQQAHAATLAQVNRAGLAGAAGLAGLRGAVLTAGAAFLGATVAIQATVKAIQTAASFERELNVFKVTAGATAEELDRVAAASRQLGKDASLPGVSASDAAEAMTELAKAGLSVEDALSGAEGVLQLATAAQISNADATLLAASALNAFNLGGEEAVRVADLLANAANQSQGSISDMGLALQQAAAVANQLGLSVQDTVTFLTILTRAGIRGSDAGTSLRVALTRLIAPTEKAQAILDRFNISLRDAEGALRTDVFSQLGAAMENLGRQDQARILFQLFGQDAQRAAAILSQQTTQALNDTALLMEREGAAAELAGARSQGFSGAVEQLSSELETLGTNLTPLLPGLALLAKVLGSPIRGANLIADALRAAREEIDETGDAATGFNERIASISGAVGDAAQGVRGFIPGLDSARAGIDNLGQGSLTTAEQVRVLTKVLDEENSSLIQIPGSVDAIIGSLGRIPTEAEIIRLEADPSKFQETLRDLVDEAQEQGTLAGAAHTREVEREIAAGETAIRLVFEHGMGTLVPIAGTAGGDAGDAFVKGFNDAQIRGQLQAQKTAVAQAQAFGETGLEELLAERDRIDRILNSARAPTGPALESLLRERESVVDEVARILEAQASEAENAAQDVKRAQEDADKALIEVLSNRRDDALRRAAAAAATEGVADDIRAQNSLQGLIKKQIAKVRDLITDEKARGNVVRELRIALIASRREEDALRAQQKADIQARRQEGIELDISFAETTQNTSREIAARQRLIALLKKQQNAVKKGTTEWKRLRNEIAEQQQAIKEARDQAEEEKDTGQSAQQFFFEQLQAQQGFAANLLGNLIPRDQTAGLVGVPSPTPASLQAQVSASANAAAGKAGGGPTAGQASTTNDILLRILEQLRSLNDDREHPEATRQRRKQMAVMDFEHGQGGVM